MGALLDSCGVDVFYIDESTGPDLFVVSAVQIPFLCFGQDGVSYVWQDFLDMAAAWRRQISANCAIKLRKELHASKMLYGKGCYHRSGRNLLPDEAADVVGYALGSLSFLPNAAVTTAFSDRNTCLFGTVTVEAAMVGLLQRLRTKCKKENRNGLIFFDNGHMEYIGFYRRACKYLPTGSRFGSWSGMTTKNLPLEMFLKDANQKVSEFSLFLQIADLVCHTAHLKLKGERSLLTAKQQRYRRGELYDAIAAGCVNTDATRLRADGLAPILTNKNAPR
jgi:hypothetical protein